MKLEKTAERIEWEKSPDRRMPPPSTRYTGKCDCGEVITFTRRGCNGMGDEECPKCGSWYNASGQGLRPPREWGEDTGEVFDDGGHYVGGGDE